MTGIARSSVAVALRQIIQSIGHQRCFSSKPPSLRPADTPPFVPQSEHAIGIQPRQGHRTSSTVLSNSWHATNKQPHNDSHIVTTVFPQASEIRADYRDAMLERELRDRPKQLDNQARLAYQPDQTQSSDNDEWHLAFKKLNEATPLANHNIQVASITWPNDVAMHCSKSFDIIQYEVRQRTGCRADFLRHSIRLAGTEQQIRNAYEFINRSQSLVFRRQESSYCDQSSHETLRADATLAFPALLSFRPTTEESDETICEPEFLPKKIAIPFAEAKTIAQTGKVIDAVHLHNIVRSISTLPTLKERQELSKEVAGDSPFGSLNLLVQLLSNPENASKTMTSTLDAVIMRLANHLQYTGINKILTVHDNLDAQEKEQPSAIAISTYNILLYSAARRCNVQLFRRIIDSIQERGFTTNHMSWMWFHKLTKSTFAEDDLKLEKVETQMRINGTAKNQFAYRYLKDSSAEDRLAKFVEQHRPAEFSINKFLKSEGQLYKSANWMSHQYCTLMIKRLLSDGHWDDAIEVLETHSIARLPSSHLLELFLEASTSPGVDKVSVVVRVMEVFERCCVGKLQQVRELRDGGYRNYQLPAEIYEMLFHIANTSLSWNMLRVVWQHARSTGNVTYRMKHIMFQSHARAIKPLPPVLDPPTLWSLRSASFAADVERGMRAYHRDLKQGDRSVPEKTLAHDLMEAWRIDQEFARLEIWPAPDPDRSRSMDDVYDAMLKLSYKVRWRSIRRIRKVITSPQSTP